MESSEKELSSEESLRIISEMVHAAKTEITDKSFFYLLWGWLVFTASLGQFMLITVIPSNYNYLPWTILMPLGGIVTSVYSARMKKKERVKTLLDEFMKYALTAFLLSLFIVLFSTFRSENSVPGYPLIMMVYGAWLFISGGVLRFKPLMAGGIINWALCITAMFFGFPIQLLLLALAVLLGYIIPGYMLKARHRKQ
jgi:hypothetical protein